MKHINDDKKLQQLLTQYDFQSIFGTTNLPFFLVYFEKGDDINHLLNPSKYLIFLLQSTSAIYHIRADGTKITLFRGNDRLSCLGDMEFTNPTATQYEISIEKECLAIVLSLDTCRKDLENNTQFLRWLCYSLSSKLNDSGRGNVENITLENAVLYHMKNHHNTLQHPGIVAEQLHCSRRQLQRILNKLINEEKITKVRKGLYTSK